MATETPKPKRGQEVIGEVIDLAYGGAGVVRSDGWVVMARGCFPGDRVRLQIRKRRKGIFEADLLEVITPAADRIPAVCPHTDLCGGCALQGLDPAAQTRYKAVQARELLRRIGKFEPEVEAEPWRSPNSFFYRNKMEFTFGARPWLSREDLDAGHPFEAGPALGLHPRGVFQGVFNVTDCQLQSELSNRITVTVRREAQELGLTAYDCRQDKGLLRHIIVRQSATTNDLLVVLVIREEDERIATLSERLQEQVPEITGQVACFNRRKAMIATGEDLRTLVGRPLWREKMLDLTYEIGPISFFQTQTAGGEALIREVLEVGGFAEDDSVLDLYCGIGAFSLPIARHVRSLMGVEVLPEAVTEAKRNAQLNDITNVHFVASPVEAKKNSPQAAANQVWENPPGRAPGRPAWDAIVIDPPRSGLHPRALEKVRGLAAPRIIYVSCNPSTLARDAGLLVTEDGYRPTRLRVFDLFPQTPHLESVLVLERGPR